MGSRKQECKKWHRNVHLNNVEIGQICFYAANIQHISPLKWISKKAEAHTRKKGSTNIFLSSTPSSYSNIRQNFDPLERGRGKEKQRNKKNMCDRNGFSVSNSAFSLFRPFLVAAKSIIRMPLFVVPPFPSPVKL